MITTEIISEAFGINPPEYLAQNLQATCDAYGIKSRNEIAAFLAQIGHESGNFQFTKENLNYSKQGLLKTFPKYFNEKTAEQYARKPINIANRVYANRMGNGDESSGDGWIYAAKGFIQITGKSNYTSYAKDKGCSLDDITEFLQTPEGASDSAGWFWWKNKLNNYVDDFEMLTKKINGGLNGYDDRLQHYHKLLDILPDDEQQEYVEDWN